MSITIIKGPSKTGKSLIATALRNNQISNKNGALLVDESSDGELDVLLEKLLIGINLPAVVDNLSELPWKPEPMVILVGDKASAEWMAAFEARLPGFAAFFGPVYTINTSVD
jgi:hypothetical protein